MRADRLLSVLLLLQTRGRMTAHRLARELEVSERTIYRDIDALSVAGVPVYAERGIGGGFALLDSYRTTLTGLTDNEVRAFFMLSIPAPLLDLGVTQELKAALLKISASLPDAHRHTQEYVRQRVLIDPTGWLRSEELVPHLPVIQKAVWQNQKLRATYRLPFDTHVERLIRPYGLVAKAGVWHVVFGRDDCDAARAMRVSSVLQAHLVDEGFEHPVGFDLSQYWSEWCAKHEQNRPRYLVAVRAAPDLVRELPRMFGDEIHREASASRNDDDDGWETLVLPFESFESARTRILGFGGSVEVLRPRELRKSVVDFATQVVSFYAGAAL